LLIQHNFISKPNIAMKTLRVLLVATAITATSLMSSIAAHACDEGSTYKGGGYTVSINGEGGYYGCNAKQQCLEISQYSFQEKGRYVWENKGTTYSMTPIGGKEGWYRLKVTDANQRVLVSKIMKPTV
jgi:hypothetical protein